MRSPRTPLRRPAEAPRSNVWRANSTVSNRHDTAPGTRHCHHQPGCGACHLLRDNYENLLRAKYEPQLQKLQQLEILQNTKILPVRPSSRRQNYRAHAKLAVRASKPAADGSATPWTIGLFEPGSHQVFDTTGCALHKESITRLMRDLQPALQATTMTPYNEADGTGDLRYIAVRASHLTEELLVTFVMTSDAYLETLKSMTMQLRRLDHRISGTHLNINTSAGNAIFGTETKLVIGSETLRERLCDLDFAVAPTTFFQINPWQAEQIYRRLDQVCGAARDGQVAWDLYCGIGQISSLLARQGYKVLGIEENPASVRWARHNLLQNGLNGEFLDGRTEDLLASMPAWATSPKVIVANPSRRGIASPVVDKIAAVTLQNRATFIYVSCEAETMGRDLQQLTRAGLKVRQLEAFDMFPYTDKLEWIAVVTP